MRATWARLRRGFYLSRLIGHRAAHTFACRSASRQPFSTHVIRSAKYNAPLRENFIASRVSQSRELTEEQTWRDLLDDAALYGIQDSDRLLYEADVNLPAINGPRLIDSTKKEQDIGLWLILLRTQALLNGHDGIKIIYQAMLFNRKGLKFYQSDSRFNDLWKVFLSSGAVEAAFLRRMCKDAVMRSIDRPALFAEVVGTALESSSPEQAPMMAQYLFNQEKFRGQQDLITIFHAACRSESSKALKSFCDIYDRLPTKRMYSIIISHLWSTERSDDAISMHSFLVSRGDLPPQFASLAPHIRYLAIRGQGLDSFLQALDRADVVYEAQARRLWASEHSRVVGRSAETLNITASRTMGIEPKKLSDEFIARALATRSFSFNFVVNTLRLAGLIEVGPEAVRQMVISSPDIGTLQARFKLLRELEVDFGSSAFVRVIRNAAGAGKWEIAQSLANSDMHHEVFEDSLLQQRLAVQFYRTGDWKQLNQSLAILNQGKFDSAAQETSANVLLQALISNRDWHGAVDIVSMMRGNGWSVQNRQIKSLVDVLFENKQAPVASVRQQEVDILHLLIGCLQEISASGTHIHITRWRVVLKVLVRLRRLDELEALIFWIAEWYGSNGRARRFVRTPSTYQENNLSILFTPGFQKSLIASSFRPPRGVMRQTAQTTMRWTRILARLRNHHSVPIDDSVVSSAFTTSLQRLFVHQSRPKLQSNLAPRRSNFVPLRRYLQLYSSLWKPLGQAEIVKMTRGVRKARLDRPRPRIRNVNKNGPEDALSENSDERLQKDHQLENAVVYRDVFNPSWEEYKGRRT